MAGTDPAPGVCCRWRPSTLTALASLAHDWELGIRSAYLPESLIRER